MLVLRNFNVKIGQERYYQAIIGNYSLHNKSNDIKSKLVNFSDGKDLVVKSTMFSWKNTHKYT